MPRKKGSKKGVVTQRPFSTKLDISNYVWVQGFKNKSEYINKLIYKDRKEN